MVIEIFILDSIHSFIPALVVNLIFNKNSKFQQVLQCQKKIHLPFPKSMI